MPPYYHTTLRFVNSWFAILYILQRFFPVLPQKCFALLPNLIITLANHERLALPIYYIDILENIRHIVMIEIRIVAPAGITERLLP